MNIRKATKDDAESLASLHYHTILDVYGSIYPAAVVKEWSNGHTTASWVSRIESENTLLVAEEDGGIWGCGGLVRNRTGVYVHPLAQRRGIATSLLERLENIARERGVAELELSAPERAIVFYESVGFTVIGPTIHLFKGGSGLTTYGMRKRLAHG